MGSMWRRASFVALTLALGGCRASEPTAGPHPQGSELRAGDSVEPVDDELIRCRKKIGEVEKTASLAGRSGFESKRAEILGRARGEPMVFVREPRATPSSELGEAARRIRSELERARSSFKVRRIARRYRGDLVALRAAVLREGYLYSSDPIAALAMVDGLRLTDLFDDQTVWLGRGATTHELTLRDKSPRRYVHASGPLQGGEARLLFGDRVSRDPEEHARPLHRDLAALARTTGFDRASIQRRTESALVARLRFGDHWARTLLSSRGAELSIECIDAEKPVRQVLSAWRRAKESERRSLASLRASVGRIVAERLPFDRPREAEDHLSDGQLRPLWNWAYRQGRRSFVHEEKAYSVYDAKGRPRPPQVCVEFILDSFERAAGSWFRPLGQGPGRGPGRLDFDELGLKNRQGVIAFYEFAESRPDLFEVERFEGDERIPFGQRSRFFAFLESNADRFRPGDIVAIRGIKRDGNLHQHAILIEDKDPVTGFPHALADQMKVPRRRTWEGIMAEAPRRSLYYRVRLRPEIVARLASSG